MDFSFFSDFVANVKSYLSLGAKDDSEIEVYSASRVRHWMKVLAVVAFSIIALVLLLYFVQFRGELSESSADWAAFGDFVGGSLNPILAFLSFIALLIPSKLSGYMRLLISCFIKSID